MLYFCNIIYVDFAGFFTRNQNILKLFNVKPKIEKNEN